MRDLAQASISAQQPLNEHYRSVTPRIPDQLLLGKAVIREIPVSDTAYQAEFEIIHSLWGRTFGYSVQFKLCEGAQTSSPSHRSTADDAEERKENDQACTLRRSTSYLSSYLDKRVPMQTMPATHTQS